MDRNCSMTRIFTNALKNFYGKKGYAKDLMFYKGHSKLSQTFVKLYNISGNT